MRREKFEYYRDGLLAGDRNVLSKSISIIESQSEEDHQLAMRILSSLPAQESIRIGISGAPGVGKSTFIEAFGQTLIEDKHKLAVLAIDPSSPFGGGSILGDKTRMSELSRLKDVYIRPSASLNHVGGTGAKTYQTMLLCEAAGFDRIIIETVGVGQTEAVARQMVDFFLLLAQPASGDELQGIKKGIMEHVDGIVVNKADNNLIKEAKRTQMELREALHYLSTEESPKVLTCSSTEGAGMKEIKEWILDFCGERKENGGFAQRRKEQSEAVLVGLMQNSLMKFISSQQPVKDQQSLKLNELKANKLNLIQALDQFERWLQNQSLSD
ncbi:methylmalonyl Co-A mutase-associated GTPase MeaB [Reichenbachiella ulvae]|uniref:Methylmalonyl Co-A mutase-associated GTPase MeaB n=1 Tax=Reichenbachiella ulvae TaxID=2980104 RepID=A0ABT3CQK5_9BACT|nr:methylmalonyl Co-A mutase-associated GTPase MeaB [Reichenbachiella ulvae]MCV9385755.1 methylmalonyl Co-A mutase-associated GTPase MeaB [Reichenbachiella ulvae]